MKTMIKNFALIACLIAGWVPIAVSGATTSGARRASIGNTTATAGGTVTALVQMAAQGDENALSFSVTFDPVKLNYISTSLGSGGTGASLVVNTNLAPSGKVGVVISMPVNQSLPAGNIELLKLNFRAGSVAGSATVAFGNSPAPESVSDALGHDLSVAVEREGPARGEWTKPHLEDIETATERVLTQALAHQHGQPVVGFSQIRGSRRQEDRRSWQKADHGSPSSTVSSRLKLSVSNPGAIFRERPPDKPKT